MSAVISQVHFRWEPETNTLRIFGADNRHLRVEYSHFEIQGMPVKVEFGIQGSPIAGMGVVVDDER